jgi:predicted N-acetyltransferase YhbS
VARSLVSTAVEAARAVGAGAVTLMASDEGRPLYEGLGFSAVPAMRLSFDPPYDPSAPSTRSARGASGCGDSVEEVSER